MSGSSQRRIGTLAFGLALAAGCASYDCATYTAFGYDFREQCGPLGVIGAVYFGEGVATMLMGPSIDDFESTDFELSMEYGPMIDIAFEAAALDSLGPATVIDAECARRECFDCLTEFFEAGSAEVEVLEPSRKDAIGGRSWRVRWSVDCPGEASMSSTGEDVVEFQYQETGHYLDGPPLYSL
jgi:hypothetical protein